MNALGSMKGLAGDTGISLLGSLLIPGVWGEILDLVCGSIHNVDMRVQNRIWREVLCGPGIEEFLESDESESEVDTEDDDNDYWMIKPFPPGVSEFWRFLFLDLKESCQVLVTPLGADGILMVVIAFLGPWRDFGVADGARWNRGPPRGRYCVGSRV